MESEEDYVEDIAGQVPADHVGIQLKQQRLELGRELADIAHQTRVPLRHLTAIEEGNHDTLPALPYTIGFVKSYARAVGLDPDACAERFRLETTKSDRIVPSMIHEPIGDARVPSRGAALLGILLLAIVALAVVGYAAGWFGGSEEEIAPVADATGAASAPVAVGAQDPTLSTPAPAEAPAAQPSDATTASTSPDQPVATAATAEAGTAPIVISAREDAWVKIYPRGGGESLMMGVMAAGDRYEVPAGRSDLVLWTGRAGALDITVGGKPVPPLGAPTETVKDIPLTPAGLSAPDSQGE